MIAKIVKNRSLPWYKKTLRYTVPEYLFFIDFKFFSTSRCFSFQIFAQRTIQKDATALCTQLLQAFSPCLHKLAFDPPEITSIK